MSVALREMTRAEKLALLARLREAESRGAATGPLTFPVSFAQRRFWFLEQLEPETAHNNVFRAVRLRGPFDERALARAVDLLVRRHGALRTRLERTDGDPVQVVEPPAAVPRPLAQVDLSALDAPARETGLARLARAEAARPFDLERAPLVRLTLVRLARDEHALLVALHHAVADGWSLAIFFRELSEAYGAALAGRAPALPPVRLSYGEVARAQRERLDGAGLDREIAFWRAELAGAPRVLDLPTDRPRPTLGRFRGATVPLALSAETTAALKRLAREERSTPFMVLLAAFAVVLGRWSRQDDLLLGVPVAGRPTSEAEEVIGPFANTLVLRVELAGARRFRDLVGRVRTRTLAAMAHQETPFEHLVEALAPERDLSRNPLFQTMFALQNMPPASLALGGAEVVPLAVERGLSKVDLTLDLVERGGAVTGYLEYDSDLFDRATADRLAGHVRRLAEAVAAEPDLALLRFWLPGEAERAELLRAAREVELPVPAGATVDALFRAAATDRPDHGAIETDGGSWSYRELRRAARRISLRLVARGVRPGDRVGVLTGRSPEAVAAFLGVLEAGAAYVPLDPEYPAERLAYMLEDSGARVVLAEQGAPDPPAAGAPGVEVLPLERRDLFSPLDRREDAEDTEPIRTASPEQPAYVIYTSGTTGRPKGVVVPHRALASHALAVAAEYGLDTGDRVLQFAAVSFDVAGEEIYPTLAQGATLYLRPEGVTPSPAELVRTVAERRLSVVNVPTPLWHEWVRELAAPSDRPDGERSRAEPPACLRLVVVGTEGALPERLAEWRERLGAWDQPRWVNAYGPTEATITATVFSPGPESPGRLPRVPIGRPVANVRAHVLDRSARLAGLGVPGELHLGGPGLATGYLGRPAVTAAAFVPDPYAPAAGPGSRLYRTGDLVRRTEGGLLEFLGRTDDQVKVRGFRIEPGEVEAVIGRHPRVREVAVVPVTAGPGDVRLAAYVACGSGESGAAPGAEVLRAFIAARLPAYMVPASFVVLDALPLTPSGKVDRRALPPPEWSAPAADHVPPRGPLEEMVAGIWCEVLGVDRVGVHDDFFRLGGHSLLATRVTSRLRDRLGVEVPLRALFEAPTISALAPRVSAARGAPQAPPVVPVPRSGRDPEELPLSFAQQRLWFLDRLEPGVPIYNVPAAARLETPDGSLDRGALEGALEAIVERHEALRTTFGQCAGGEPVQRVHRRAPVELGSVDLTGLDPAGAAACAARLGHDEGRRPFDLETGPLFRFTLLVLPGAGGGAPEHRLLFTFHHVVADGWSSDLFLRELAALYDAFAAGRPSPLPPLPVQYGDYAAWQREALAGEGLEALLGFWRTALAGAPQVLDLPTDRPRPPVPSYRGGRRYLRLSPETAEAATALGRKEGASPFMVALAAFEVLLARLSGGRDLLLGTPVAGRGRSELEGLIGFFVNTLVLRAELAGEPDLPELLRRVRASTLDAFAHAELPFERLVEEMDPDRDLSHNPLFQVMFSFQTTGVAPAPAGALRPVLLSSYNHTSRVDLALNLWPDRGGLTGFVEYATDLFDATTAERFAGAYERLVRSLVAEPQAPVLDRPFLSAAERQQVLVEWGEGSAGGDGSEGVPSSTPGATLDALFEASARATPDAVAVVGADGSLTYRELAARASRLAGRLAEAGVGPETLVGLCVGRSTRTVVALLGILRAGGAYVPLDPAFPRRRLAHMVDAAELPVLVAEEELLGALPEAVHGRRLVLLDREDEAGDGGETSARAPSPSPRGPVGPESLAYVLFTSGSTGGPKGVQVSHGAAVNFLCSMARRPGLGAGETILAVTTLSFDIALLELVLPLTVSGRVVVATAETARSGDELAARIAETAPDVVQATPATWRLLLASGWAGPPPAKVLCGGEALPPELATRLLATGADLWNLYGPTETTVWSAVLPIARGAGAGGEAGAPDKTRTVPIGGSVAATSLRVLDPAGRPQPVGVPGELGIGGRGLARGYLSRPGLSAERFRPDPYGREPGARLYGTGDLVRWRPDGRLDFLGRLDHQVKVRGFRIELGEIEAALARQAGVRQAAVVAREDAGGDRRLVAYLVAGSGGAPSPSRLRARLSETLPEYMVPAVFVELPELPLTPNGKVDRARLPEPGGARPDLERTYVAPRTPTEMAIAEVWAEVLRVERVGVDDNFFELGGHSLKATQVATRIEEAFGVELPLRALFESPTVARLAERVVELEIETLDADALAAALNEIDSLSEAELAALVGPGRSGEGDV